LLHIINHTVDRLQTQELNYFLGFSMRMVDPHTGLPTNSTAGNIQIHTGGKWRFWDGLSGFNTRQTRVACRELGFIRPFNFHIMYNLTSVMGNVVTNENIKCVGTEKKLSDCFHGNWKFLNKTNHFYLVWVKCGKLLSSLKCPMISTMSMYKIKFLDNLEKQCNIFIKNHFHQRFHCQS
jgi:hypothetical protein